LLIAGSLDYLEIKAVCRKILKISSKDVPDEDIQKLVKLMDNDGSGDIDIEEVRPSEERSDEIATPYLVTKTARSRTSIT